MIIDVLKGLVDVSEVEKMFRLYVRVIDKEDYPTGKIFENEESNADEVLDRVHIGKEHEYKGKLVESLYLFGVVRRTPYVPDELFTDDMEEVESIKEAVIEIYDKVLSLIRAVLKEGGYKELTICEEVEDV